MGKRGPTDFPDSRRGNMRAPSRKEGAVLFAEKIARVPGPLRGQKSPNSRGKMHPLDPETGKKGERRHSFKKTEKSARIEGEGNTAEVPEKEKADAMREKRAPVETPQFARTVAECGCRRKRERGRHYRRAGRGAGSHQKIRRDLTLIFLGRTQGKKDYYKGRAFNGGTEKERSTSILRQGRESILIRRREIRRSWEEEIGYR